MLNDTPELELCAPKSIDWSSVRAQVHELKRWMDLTSPNPPLPIAQPTSISTGEKNHGIIEGLGIVRCLLGRKVDIEDSYFFNTSSNSDQ